jgi:long-chain acyl-CoA synthetase
MGESDSGWTPAFNVLYWPLRAFSRGLFDTVPALAHGRVDVVPVDYVADGIVYLLDHSDTGVFNLVAGHEAPTVDELIEMGTRRFELPRPELVEPGEPTALADGEVYVPYFDMKVVFDDAHAREVLEPAGIHAPKLADYFGHLIDYAEVARWGKRPMSRQAARERLEPAAA